MRHRIMLLAALAALGAVAAGCGGGGSAAANAAAPRGAAGPPPHTVDGITFSQVVTAVAPGGSNSTGGAEITFTVANGTTGSATWACHPYFSGTATSATGQVTDFPPPGGPTGAVAPTAINIGPGQSASVTEPCGGLPPGTYTISSYIHASLWGTAFGASDTSLLPGDPDTTQTANPVTITVP